jgi:predicted GNAT superfamily acetyltransferase
MNCTLLSAQTSDWANRAEAFYHLLGGAHNPTLFPPHFLLAVLPRIGGQVALFEQAGKMVGVGFLFPRLPTVFAPRHRLAYTFRYHHLLNGTVVEPAQLMQTLALHLHDADLHFYDPQSRHTFSPTYAHWADCLIGRPSAAEADVIRSLQQQVWGSPLEFLYPSDIHSVDFALGTSLVARQVDKPVGFLFGFYKFGGYPLPADWQSRFDGDLRLESQTLGVLPEYRGASIGFLLKQAQAKQALAEGVQIINWTVDPLQWPNAQLNFGRLRALAFDFTPDYYPFRNELNRVAASRFGLTWLVGTQRVKEGEEGRVGRGEGQGATERILALGDLGEVVRVNWGWAELNWRAMAERIAIEIPTNWTAIQRDDLEAALRWRTATDQLFAHYIGRQPGQYVVTDVGRAGEQRFLIATRVSDGLWEQLSVKCEG